MAGGIDPDAGRDDGAATVRHLLHAVAGLGALQRVLGDPAVEDFWADASVLAAR